MLFVDSVGGGEVDPRHPVGHAHDKVTRDKAEREHRLNRQRNQFCVRRGAAFTEDIHVELMELAPPTLLGFFVAKALADFKPLERLGEIPLVLGDNPSQRGRHLWPQSHVATTLILEAKKL